MMESQATVETTEFQTQSPTISKVALALSKAQAKMTTAKRTAENPFFHSKYADLSSVWEAVRNPLAEHELAVVQTPVEDTRGTAIITTLAHSSGEWFRSKLYIIAKSRDAQSVGSAITYARRYALSAITGIAPDDDDGENATRPTVAAPKSQQTVSAVPRPQDVSNTYQANNMLSGITEMLSKMNGGVDELMEKQLRVLTTYHAKDTKEEKFLRMADLPSIAKNKPEWFKGIHKKVTDEYQRAFDATGNPK